MNKNIYPIIIRSLSEEDGGGFIALVPDLPGCMSDGESQVEALQNVIDAIDEWVEEAKRTGHDIPAPGSQTNQHKEKWEQLIAVADKQQEVISKLEDEIRSIKLAVADILESKSYDIDLKLDANTIVKKCGATDLRVH